MRAKKIMKIETSYGQSGEALSLRPQKLNAHERRVWTRLVRAGGNALTLGQLSALFIKEAGDETRANSWVRNALRRLVRGGFVAAVERGMYRAGDLPNFMRRGSSIRVAKLRAIPRSKSTRRVAA